MARLVHTGSVIVDVVMRVSRVPAPGGDTLASSTELVAGGGLNTMVASRRDGLPVLYAGLVGTGPFGTVVREALERTDIEVLYPALTDLDSGFCVALVDDTAERTFVTHVGAEGKFSYRELAGIPLEADDVVYVSGYSLATAENAVGLARWLPQVPADVPVLVDPSPLVAELAVDSFRPLLGRADILSTNATEARTLAGIDDLDDAAQVLAAELRPGSAVVIRDGAHPCRIARLIDGRPHLETVPTFPVQPVDTNGAGDTHAGVLLSGLARGLPLDAAVLRANAAASIAVTRHGPTSAPTAAEIDALLAT